MPPDEANHRRQWVAGTLFAGLAVGDRIRTGGFAVTPALSVEFARLYDPQPMHLDEAAGRESVFGELVSSGWQTMAITMRLVVEARLFGDAPLIGLGLDQARFPAAGQAGRRAARRDRDPVDDPVAHPPRPRHRTGQGGHAQPEGHAGAGAELDHAAAGGRLIFDPTIEEDEMAKTHRYSTLLTWTGAARGPTADYAGYSREFDAQIAGKSTFKGSADPTFRGDPSLHNPEELLVIALSSCHMLSYLAECAMAKIAVVAYEDAAEGTMAMAEGRIRFTEVVLRPRCASPRAPISHAPKRSTNGRTMSASSPTR